MSLPWKAALLFLWTLTSTATTTTITKNITAYIISTNELHTPSPKSDYLYTISTTTTSPETLPTVYYSAFHSYSLIWTFDVLMKTVFCNITCLVILCIILLGTAWKISVVYWLVGIQAFCHKHAQVYKSAWNINQTVAWRVFAGMG